jgi:hypothetical protein
VGISDTWRKIECGWIYNDEAHSELFSYQCLDIKESEYK